MKSGAFHPVRSSYRSDTIPKVHRSFSREGGRLSLQQCVVLFIAADSGAIVGAGLTNPLIFAGLEKA